MGAWFAWMWREPSEIDRTLVVSPEERSGGTKRRCGGQRSGGGTNVCVGQRKLSLVEPYFVDVC